MCYMVYAKFEGEKRFGALGSVGGGVDKVGNLMYAYVFDTKEKAQEFADKCKAQVPTCQFEVRKHK